MHLNHGFRQTRRFFHRMFNPEANLLVKNNYLVISDRIKEALATNKPVVALESTIITHGMPYPANCETALKVEEIIENEGAVPATIALVNGKLKVGLEKSEIEHIGNIKEGVKKVSRQDLSYLFAKKHELGGTTVSATMIAAHAAGIPIFVTGGIGGVHRDFNETMDVSADLFELARTSVTVISAGIKSILDIGRTLEYLETLGVCVAAFKTNEFPSFYSAKSGFTVPFKLDSTVDAAKLIDTHLKSGLNSGILIGVPIPDDYSLDNQQIEMAINESLKEAQEKSIKGKAVTPFLLSKIANLTKNKSLESNLALIKNNARIGAQIAIELSQLRSPKLSNSNPEVLLFGGLNVDFTYKMKDSKTIGVKGVTQPCIFNSCLGGVARNMSEALIRSGHNSVLITSLSNDLLGEVAIQKSKHLGFDTSKWILLDSESHPSTGSYCSVFDPKGELLMGCGAMDAHNYITPAVIDSNINLIKNSKVCVVDADIPVESLQHLCNVCKKENIPIWYNPTDIRKCSRIVEADSIEKLTFMSPNLKELFEIFTSILKKKQVPETSIGDKYTMENLHSIEINDLKKIIRFLLQYVPFIVLSRSDQSLLFASANKISVDNRIDFENAKNATNFDPHIAYFPIIKLDGNENIINVSGAGDSTSAGILSGILKGKNLLESVYHGLAYGKFALLTNENVSEQISSLDENFIRKIIIENRDLVFIEKL